MFFPSKKTPSLDSGAKLNPRYHPACAKPLQCPVTGASAALLGRRLRNGPLKAPPKARTRRFLSVDVLCASFLLRQIHAPILSRTSHLSIALPQFSQNGKRFTGEGKLQVHFHHRPGRRVDGISLRIGHFPYRHGAGIVIPGQQVQGVPHGKFIPLRQHRVSVRIAGDDDGADIRVRRIGTFAVVLSRLPAVQSSAVQ